MASKEATVYIVDVGAAMGGKAGGRDISDLDWALEYVWDRITTTVATDRKTAHMAVIGLKTDITNHELGDEDAYSHISVFKGLGQMLMPDLRELRKLLKPSQTDVGDAISAIVVAVSMIEEHCKKLQYLRRIVLITNGLTPVDTDDAAHIVDKIKADGIELVVLGVDFDDAEYGIKEEDKPAHKDGTERVLRDFAEQCGGMYGTLAQAIAELGVPRIKSVRPTPSYKGYLTLGDPANYDSAMSIDVERYPKVMVAKPPSASSFVIRDGGSTQETQLGSDPQDSLAAVKRASTYQVPDESAPGGKKDVEQDELAKGYAYGSTAVYISESDRSVTTFETQPGLEIIGFVDKSKFEHYMDMSRSNVIVAQRTNDKAGMALSSFIHALYELESYAVARMVVKQDKPPLILLLCPSIEPDVECLYDVELPFAEDVRQYRFPPLDRIVTVSGKTLTAHRNLPSDALKEAMSSYVDAMDLSGPLTGDEEYAPIDETFSPMLHRINQVIRHRAIHPATDLPPVPAALTRFSHPPEDLVTAARPSLKALMAAAEVKRVPPKALSKRGRGGGGGKREPAKPLSGLDVNALLNSDGSGDKGGKQQQKKRAGQRRPITTQNTIPEFRQALEAAEATGDEAEVKAVFEGMGGAIRSLVRDGMGGVNVARAVECMAVFRAECLDLEMPQPFNDWALALKTDLLAGELGGDRAEDWFRIRTSGVKLIPERDAKGGATAEEAEQWTKRGL